MARKSIEISILVMLLVPIGALPAAAQVLMSSAPSPGESAFPTSPGLTAQIAPIDSSVDCAQPEDVQLAQRAKEELSAWETRENVRLTSEVRGALVQRFCRVGAELVGEGAERSDILDRAKAPLSGYLDQLVGSDPKLLSLEDRVIASISVGSTPGLPEPRRMGVLKVTYRSQVDRVEIDGGRLDPGPVYLAEVGQRAVAGFRGATRACAGNVQIARTPVSFTC